MKYLFLLIMNSFYFWVDIADKFFIAFFTDYYTRVSPLKNEQINTNQFIGHPEVIDVTYEEIKVQNHFTYSHLGRRVTKLNKNV